MSPNNWRICPKCEKKEADEFQARRKTAQKAYGEVSQDEYLRLMNESRVFPELEQTLRENWQIGVYDGTFSVGYSCSCDACGFSWKYKYKEDLQIK